MKCILSVKSINTNVNLFTLTISVGGGIYIKDKFSENLSLSEVLIYVVLLPK